MGRAVAYLKASNAGEDDRLGADGALMGPTLAISADGRTVAVGAPYEDGAGRGVNPAVDEEAGDAGAAYVFVRNGDHWVQQAYLKASNADAWDEFGFSVALSNDGNTLAVGATLEDSAARGIDGDQRDNSAEAAGAVYVFTRSRGRWSQQAYIKASNADPSDQFGFGLALGGDGNTLAVGALSEAGGAQGINGNDDDNSAEEAGAVYVYERTGRNWAQTAYVKGRNTEGGDRFGFCLALNRTSDVLAVCGYDEDGGSRGVNGDETDNSVNGSGAAYVFRRERTGWVQEAYFKASNTRRGDAFGSAIALSGDGMTLAVCAVDEDGLSPGINGKQTGFDQIQEHSTGAVFVFTKNGGQWAQQAYVKSSNIRENDQFGLRMALGDDGNMLVAGAPLQSGGGRGVDSDQSDMSAPQSGAVYVFTRSGGQWSQRHYIKAPNAEQYDEFGGALALSADGATLAVGAPGEDGGSDSRLDAPDDQVRDAGAVYVY